MSPLMNSGDTTCRGCKMGCWDKQRKLLQEIEKEQRQKERIEFVPDYVRSGLPLKYNFISVDGINDMPERQRLSDTRNSITHKFEIGGHKVYFTVGLYEDGRPGELFIKTSKNGSTINGLMNGIGVLTSLGLQHGVPLVTMANKMKDMRFEPMEHGKATLILDYIFRWMQDRFSEDGT